MASYLNGATLAEAVERLGVSRAKPSLCDFLILKLAMTQGDGTVTLSLTDQIYTDAVRVMAAVSPPDGDESLPPYFNPFGTRNERTFGWRTEKYPSNGPPDTVNGPGWRRVIDILEEGPRRVRFTDGYLDYLPQVIARTGGPARETGPAPLLADCALWLHRERPIADDEVEDPGLVDRLVATFMADTGLSADEHDLIFGEE